MAFLDASFAVIKLDNASGTPVDISAEAKIARGSVTGNNQPFYTLGSFFSNVSDSKKSWTVTLTVFASDGATDAYTLITAWYINNNQPGSRTLTVGVPDVTSVGSLTFSGEVKCSGIDPLFDIDASGGRPQEISVTLMGDGALTQATVTA